MQKTNLQAPCPLASIVRPNFRPNFFGRKAKSCAKNPLPGPARPKFLPPSPSAPKFPPKFRWAEKLRGCAKNGFEARLRPKSALRPAPRLGPRWGLSSGPSLGAPVRRKLGGGTKKGALCGDGTNRMVIMQTWARMDMNNLFGQKIMMHIGKMSVKDVSVSSRTVLTVTVAGCAIA